jgi:RimJ/RimL family protein N-acetyltransferase
MPGPIFLEGDSVTLHPVEEEDLGFLQRLVNDPRVRRGIQSVAPLTLEDEREWHESVVEGDDVHLLVCDDDGPVGVVGLNALDESDGTAEVGYFLAPGSWGNGYATDAVERAVAYAFTERRLHKVYANVFASNDASRRVLEKAGFEREGVHREQCFVDGEHVDIYRYGLLVSEWERE